MIEMNDDNIYDTIKYGISIIDNNNIPNYYKIIYFYYMVYCIYTYIKKKKTKKKQKKLRAG
jgi:hypothetical protein